MTSKKYELTLNVVDQNSSDGFSWQAIIRRGADDSDKVKHSNFSCLFENHSFSQP